MSVTRPVVKTETLKKVKINPAWVLACPKLRIRKVVLSPGRKQRDLGVDLPCFP